MIIDELNRKIYIKISYFGPLLSGKKSSISILEHHFGKMDEIGWVNKKHQLTMLFESGTISFKSQKWRINVLLYTSTGQTYQILTKPVYPQDIDGIIFVADSQQEVYNRNVTVWRAMCDYFGDPIYTLPKFVAFNKLDARDKFCPVDFFDEIYYSRLQNIEHRTTNASSGTGVLDCFEVVLNLIFKVFIEQKEYEGGDFERSRFPPIKLNLEE